MWRLSLKWAHKIPHTIKTKTKQRPSYHFSFNMAACATVQADPTQRRYRRSQNYKFKTKNMGKPIARGQGGHISSNFDTPCSSPKHINQTQTMIQPWPTQRHTMAIMAGPRQLSAPATSRGLCTRKTGWTLTMVKKCPRYKTQYKYNTITQQNRNTPLLSIPLHTLPDHVDTE